MRERCRYQTNKTYERPVKATTPTVSSKLFGTMATGFKDGAIEGQVEEEVFRKQCNYIV